MNASRTGPGAGRRVAAAERPLGAAEPRLAPGFFAAGFRAGAFRDEEDREPALAEDLVVDRLGELCFVATGVRVPDVAPSPLADQEVTQSLRQLGGSGVLPPLQPLWPPKQR